MKVSMQLNDFENWWLNAGKPSQFQAWKIFKVDLTRNSIVKQYNLVKLNRDEVRKFVRTLREKHDCDNQPIAQVPKRENKERDFDEKHLENVYLRSQLQTKEREIQKLQNIAASDYVIVQMFKEHIKQFSPPDFVETKPLKNKSTNEEIVLLLSDIHYGEKVMSEAMLDSNCYDTEIAKQRLINWFNAVRSILNKLSGYNHQKINLFLLGDMVNGMIHEELKSGISEVDQVLELAEIISQIILELSKEYEIEVCCVVGNHGRMTKKPSFKNKYNNFDYLVYKFIEVRCANLPNVNFNIPKAGMLIKEINGHNFLLRHGDCKTQSFAGIPFYGIQRASAKITQTIAYLKDLFIHYEVLGHFHTTNALEKVGGAIIMNGTLKGGDEFALESMLSATEAKQTIFGCHREHGVTWRFDVHCGNNL